MPVEICCFGDLHVDAEWRVEGIVKIVEAECFDADVGLLVGDVTSTGDPELARSVVEVLVEILNPAPLLVVPGNHDIYVRLDEDGDSLSRLDEFTEAVREAGAVPLHAEDYYLGSVAFVGVMGWYDYGFAPDYLGLPPDAYAEKAFGLKAWADRDYVRLPYPDPVFAWMQADLLTEKLAAASRRADRFVVATHFVPFPELVEYTGRPDWDYFAAYMGSAALGEAILRHSERVVLVAHGHAHGSGREGTCTAARGVRVCNCATPRPLLVGV